MKRQPWYGRSLLASTLLLAGATSGCSLGDGESGASASAALNAPGMQWARLSGYRFLRAEMLQDDGSAGVGQGLVHPGATGCTGNPQQGTVVCAKSNRSEVRLSGFDPASASSDA